MNAPPLYLLAPVSTSLSLKEKAISSTFAKCWWVFLGGGGGGWSAENMPSLYKFEYIHTMAPHAAAKKSWGNSCCTTMGWSTRLQIYCWINNSKKVQNAIYSLMLYAYKKEKESYNCLLCVYRASQEGYTLNWQLFASWKENRVPGTRDGRERLRLFTVDLFYA